MQTEICEAAENFGEEFFREMRERDGIMLISKLFNDILSSGILPEELEYKNCLLVDLTLTGTWSRRSMDVAQTFSTTNFSSTQP